MAQATAISWTDASSNPLRYRDRATGKDVWACVKVSSGCAHCYSEALAERFGRGGPFTRERMAGLEPYLDEKELHRLLTSKNLAGAKVFLCDMTDLFGEWVPGDLLNRLFSNVLEQRTDVTFQLLTKRPERMREYLSWRWGEGRIPSRNVWLGTSVENKAAADERIPHLLATPARVRFLSCEPLLGPIEFSDVTKRSDAVAQLGKKALTGIHWVIVGGESGSGYRDCDPAWVTSLHAQCTAAGVAFFCKQGSGRKPGTPGRLPLDVFTVKEFPQ